MTGAARAHGPQIHARQVQEVAHKRQLHLRDSRAQWWTRVATIVAGVCRHATRENGQQQLNEYR
eukprot:8634917-Pyramimonas_sp.AAC.1